MWYAQFLFVVVVLLRGLDALPKLAPTRSNDGTAKFHVKEKLEKVFSNMKDDGNANYYMDQVLANLRPLIKEAGLDPMPLPDETAEFSDTTLGITTYGHATLYMGYLMGLSYVHRSGDATLDYPDDKVTFGGTIGWSNLQLGYKCSTEFDGIGPDAEVWGLVRNVDVSFMAGFNFTSGNYTMDKFDVLEIGHIDVEVTGLGPLNWITDIIVELVINTVRDTLTTVLETQISALLLQAIESLNTY